MAERTDLIGRPLVAGAEPPPRLSQKEVRALVKRCGWRRTLEWAIDLPGGPQFDAVCKVVERDLGPSAHRLLRQRATRLLDRLDV